MIKTLITLTLAISLTLQACSKGCLKCTADDKCLLCDIFQKYKLTDNACTLVEQPNCHLISLDGKCMACETNYTFNSTTSKCVAVDTANVVANCSSYNSSQVCEGCESNFYVSEGKCVAPTTLITNCEDYSNATTCSECVDSYYLSLDGKSCKKMPETSNCSHFSRFKCQSCATDYIINSNLYFGNMFSLTSDMSKYLTITNIIMHSVGHKTISDLQVCQAVKVENCYVFQDYKTCKECVSGYFLKEEGTCEIYPIDIIKNCLAYSSATTCSKCNQGFYLNNNLCVAVTNITNCSQYSQTVNQCTLCNSDYYLSNNSCSKRVKSLGSLITNCKAKSTTTDKCLDCNVNFNLSSDGEKCFANITSCLIHNPTSSTATETTCQSCIDGFYLQGTTCTQGTDTNCITYEVNQNVCKVCKEGFYHPTGLCVEHTSIPNCGVYSQTVKNTCLTCLNNTYNFVIETLCENRPIIANCLTYTHGDTTSTCETCKPGFKKDGETCIAITIANCATEVNAVCTQCLSGYTLFESTVNNATTIECKVAHDFLLDECETIVTQDNAQATKATADVTCSACKKNAFTIDMDQAYACINNDYLKVKQLEVGTLIENCMKMDTKTTCSQCAVGFYLSSDTLSCLAGGCGTNGVAETYSSIVLANDGQLPANYFVKKSNSCDGLQVDNILLMGPNIGNNYTLVPIKCFDTKPTIIDLSNDDYTIVNPEGGLGNWIQSPMDVFPSVQCPTNKTHINGVQTTTLIDRCKYYFVYDGVQTPKIGCLRCDHGYSGKAHADGYIISCTSNSFCSSGVEYKNLKVFWGKQLSCHKCSDSNKIPYVVGLTSAKNNYGLTKYKPFTFATSDWFAINNDDRLVNICVNNTSSDLIRSDLKIDAAVTNDKILFVANCGAGFLNLNYNGDTFDSTDVGANALSLKQAILCLACKPGYKASYISNTNAKLVKTCTAITNCSANSTWFNGCSQCDSGYVHAVDADDEVDWASCVAYNKDTNCYSYNDTLKKCIQCKKGYFLTRDNYCEKVKAPRCKDSQFVPFMKYRSTQDTRYNLYAHQQGPGCNDCESGYTAFKHANGRFSQYACAAYSYITTNITTFPKSPNDGDSVFINNCESYENKSTNLDQGSLVCKKCNTNYVMRTDGSECMPLSTVANCITAALTGNKCVLCNDGYGLLTSGICSLGSIANCKNYNSSDSAAVATCKICNPGYYLDKNTCVVGGVAHCDVYNDQYKCDTCETGYILISENNLEGDGVASHNYCYPNDSSLNCSVGTMVNDTLGGKFACTTCEQAYGKPRAPSETEAKTKCLTFNVIDNCKKYDVGSTLLSSTLYCTECNTGFYFDKLGSVCVKRTVLPTACKLYDLDSDVCELCNEGNYLSQNAKDCQTYPTGVIGCRVYQDAATCTACDPDRWLDGNLCPLVVAEKKVTNCLFYSNAETCSYCQSGYFLANNTCSALTVQNCAKVAAVNACENCLPGFVLKTENGNTNCTAHTKANCALFEQTGTYPCITCNQNFFVDANGDCQPATVISNCLINDSKDSCKLCESDYALAVDKKTCVNKQSFDDQCAVTVMPVDLNCSVCSAGYFFKDNVCTAFEKNTIGDGCFSSDPVDNTICYVCNTGYYMKKDQSCVKIGGSTTPTTPTSNVGIMKTLIAVLMTLMILV